MSQKKKPYEKPKIKKEGRLRDLTQVKKGTSNDGGGKPKTRLSGGSG